MGKIKPVILVLGVLGTTAAHLGSCGSSDGPSRLDDFCHHAIQACTVVGLEQCKTILAQAGKSPEQKDIDCARSSLDCDDTDLCLTSIGGATSQPSP